MKGPGREEAYKRSLAPFGNALRAGGAYGVLSFGEKREPKTALSVGFRGLELIAIGGLQSYVSISDGFAVDVQHLATDRARPCRRWRSRTLVSRKGTAMG